MSNKQLYEIENIDAYLLHNLRMIEKSDCKNMPAVQSAIKYVQDRINEYKRSNWTYADMIAKMLTDAVTK